MYPKALEDPSTEVMLEKLLNHLVAMSYGYLIPSDLKNPPKILQWCGIDDNLFDKERLVTNAGALVNLGMYRLIPKPAISFRGEQQTA